jgi:hypothetical protein
MKVAERCWSKADPKDFSALKADYAKKALSIPSMAVTSVGE